PEPVCDTRSSRPTITDIHQGDASFSGCIRSLHHFTLSGTRRMGLGAIRDGIARVQSLETSATSAWISALHFCCLVRKQVVWVGPRIFIALRKLRGRRALCRGVVLYHSSSI